LASIDASKAALFFASFSFALSSFSFLLLSFCFSACLWSTLSKGFGFHPRGFHQMWQLNTKRLRLQPKTTTRFEQEFSSTN
jgi:hypothetical protein